MLHCPVVDTVVCDGSAAELRGEGQPHDPDLSGGGAEEGQLWGGTGHCTKQGNKK